MNFIVTSLYDEKTKQYMVPVVEQTEAVARRNFAYALTSNASLAFAASDLRLYQIGSFDSDTGTLSAVSIPTLIADGKEFSKDE